MNLKLTPTLFVISTKLAIVWAGLGIPFTIIASLGQHHVIHLTPSAHT